MARETVITEVVEEKPKDGVVLIPQNKAFYVDQFTDEAPNPDDEREVYTEAKCTNDVFAHYKPTKEIELLDEKESPVYETFNFNSIVDFEDEQLIKNSDYLRSEQDNIDALNKVIRQLKDNKTLRNVLKDENARKHLSGALKALLSELEIAEKTNKSK